LTERLCLKEQGKTVIQEDFQCQHACVHRSNLTLENTSYINMKNKGSKVIGKIVSVKHDGAIVEMDKQKQESRVFVETELGDLH
jgi:exosome complex RNA-binding protein Csl4